ncbi:MAG: 4'-phosphopantetheinyl transferase superfamily protein, partial [Litorilituus sp.]|nr:4'-phosphopantetheinyl transferase superfamily protein [Litorilituus sp.]
FCLLSRANTRKSIRVGIDYEQYITEHLVAGIQGSILNDEEAKLCRRSAYDFNKALTLVFSAKESLFKALYPSVNRYFDFMDARVTAFKIRSKTKGHNNETLILTLILNTDLNTKFHKGKCFSISYQWVNKGVLTFLIDKV